MSPLEAARLLSQRLDPVVDNFCEVCETEGGRRATGTLFPHAPDCPWLAFPKIVAALEAAERLMTADNAQPWGLETPIALQPYGSDAVCYWCGGDYKRAHTDDCPWQALVAALKGEEVKA